MKADFDLCIEAIRIVGGEIVNADNVSDEVRDKVIDLLFDLESLILFLKVHENDRISI